MSIDQAAELIDSLATADDKLWPIHAWPAMRFRTGLQPGARGGHGPIRYTVQDYEPGRSAGFHFTAPAGFNGIHCFNLNTDSATDITLRHTVDMQLSGLAVITWPLLYGPLHDALMEDALDRAELFCGVEPDARHYSLWVRVLRWLLKPRRKH